MNRSQLVDYGQFLEGTISGGVLGRFFDLRPYNFRKGLKLSQAFSNRSYRLRMLFIARWEKAGPFRSRFFSSRDQVSTGTPYTAWGGFFALEKFEREGRLDYTLVHPGRTRSPAPLTQEVFQIMGNKYNPYWESGASPKRAPAPCTIPLFTF